MGDVDLSVRLLVEMIAHGFGQFGFLSGPLPSSNLNLAEEDDLDSTADDLVAVLKVGAKNVM